VDISKLKKIYMIGIKGVGMTMLAQYLSAQGILVSGSDTGEVFITDEALKKSGIKVFDGFNANNIPDTADLIIYSTAYNAERNEEVRSVLAGKIKVMAYAEALGVFFNSHFGIAVCGSHGKTTTTAWLGFVLERAGVSPSTLVGSFVPQFGGAATIGRSDYLIIEADEYQNKLKNFQPKAVLLNNIDYDHPDFFPTADDYQQVFIDFIGKIPKSGWLVANFDDRNIKKIAAVNTHAKIISYAINESADYVAYDIKSFNGEQFFKVKMSVDETETDGDVNDLSLGDFNIKLIGRHNVYNALAVISASIELGTDLTDIRTYLSEFTGTARRLQTLGGYHGAMIIDDYAHHPTEVKATLEALRQKYPKNKLIIVFHPHTFTRTKALLEDFAKCFTGADELIILDIFGSAREKQGGVTSQELMEKIRNWNLSAGEADQESGIGGQDLKYISSLEEVEKFLRKHIGRGDVVVTMGAGDVYKIGERLIRTTD
jgi:UDP-N-acetylmuramate--alanine ligase